MWPLRGSLLPNTNSFRFMTHEEKQTGRKLNISLQRLYYTQELIECTNHVVLLTVKFAMLKTQIFSLKRNH